MDPARRRHFHDRPGTQAPGKVVAGQAEGQDLIPMRNIHAGDGSVPIRVAQSARRGGNRCSGRPGGEPRRRGISTDHVAPRQAHPRARTRHRDLGRCLQATDPDLTGRVADGWLLSLPYLPDEPADLEDMNKNLDEGSSSASRPRRMQSTKPWTSENQRSETVRKVSEGPAASTTGGHRGCLAPFVLRESAELTLRAFLVPLFGRFLEGVLGSSLRPGETRRLELHR